MSGHVALVCLCVLFVWSVSSTVLREDGHQSSAETEEQASTRIVEEDSRPELDARTEGVEEKLRLTTEQLTVCTARLNEAQQKITTPSVTSSSHQNEAESLRAEVATLKQQLEESAQNLKIKSDDLERLEKTKAQCNREVTALTGDVAKLRGKEEEWNRKLAKQTSDLQKGLSEQISNLKNDLLKESAKIGQDIVELKTVNSKIKNSVLQSASDSNTTSTLMIQNLSKNTDKILEEINSSKTKVEAGFVQMTSERDSKFSDLQSRHREMLEVIELTKKQSTLAALGVVLLEDHFYYFSNRGRMTWFDARDFCVSKGLTLASIESDDENDIVFEHLKELGMTATWLGGSDEAREGTWRWTGTGATMTYTNWLLDEPDGGSRENCLLLSTGGEWYDDDCTNTRPFICEKHN